MSRHNLLICNFFVMDRTLYISASLTYSIVYRAVRCRKNNSLYRVYFHPEETVNLVRFAILILRNSAVSLIKYCGLCDRLAPTRFDAPCLPGRRPITWRYQRSANATHVCVECANGMCMHSIVSIRSRELIGVIIYKTETIYDIWDKNIFVFSLSFNLYIL